MAIALWAVYGLMVLLWLLLIIQLETVLQDEYMSRREAAVWFILVLFYSGVVTTVSLHVLQYL